MTGFLFGSQLLLARCPHCGTGRPQVIVLGEFGDLADPRTGQPRRFAVYKCTACNGVILAQGARGDRTPNFAIERLYPEARSAASEIPEPARKYLQQALETVHAPDAAAIMAGSAVNAMLKHFGLVEGSVYNRIDQAVAQHILTASMGDWAHEVRLGSNRPRHADDKRPHVTPDEAQQSVEFAEALGHFLFVLSSRVAKGIADAKKAT